MCFSIIRQNYEPQEGPFGAGIYTRNLEYKWLKLVCYSSSDKNIHDCYYFLKWYTVIYNHMTQEKDKNFCMCFLLHYYYFFSLLGKDSFIIHSSILLTNKETAWRHGVHAVVFLLCSPTLITWRIITIYFNFPKLYQVTIVD